ncbi:MAG: hypothetical protein PWP65_1059 [Clostridia bacterium]|nr:hypothetical protein [Clostridia bacterium]
MSRRRRLPVRIQESLASFLELPQDAALDLPKITLFGNLKLILENHRGIIAYTSEAIRISTTLGEIKINGKNMILRHIKSDLITVEGDIRGIEYGLA